MPKYKRVDTEVGPKRVFCPRAYKEKALFPNYTAALSFLQEQADGFTRHMGTFAKAVYYCPSCKGWHLTKRVPVYADDAPEFDGVVIGGNVYVGRPVKDGIDGCHLCDARVVERCKKGGIMPCLAYKGDVYMHKAETLLLARRMLKNENR